MSKMADYYEECADRDYDERVERALWDRPYEVRCWRRVGAPSKVIVEQENGTLAGLSYDVAMDCENVVWRLASNNEYSTGAYDWMDAGEYLGKFTEDGFVRHREEKKMFSLEELKDEVAGLTEGQKIHLVNHIYKHYGVYPTKLRGAVEAADVNPELAFKVGDVVRIKYSNDDCNNLEAGENGMVVEVDEKDTYLPYKVFVLSDEFGECREWARADQLEAV